LQLSVIIVNYNVKFFLEQCLLSAAKATKNIDAEIFLVDNNSTDGSRAFFENKFPAQNISFTWNDRNTGFAVANNEALKNARGEYILFLNPDIILPEDCLEKCISFIRSKDNNCALGIKMLDGSGNFLRESKRSFPSPSTSLYKLSGLARVFPRSKVFAKYHLGNLSENENHEVDVLAGAFMMIPQKILAITGGFDEEFFMYGEDIDLSFRIQEAGFKNFYFAESSIIHFKGESTKKGSLNYVKMFYTAMIVFVKKHYKGTRAGTFYFLIKAAIFFRAGLAAIARLLKWIGLPVIDAGIILMSFWIVKFLWSSFIKQQVNYSPNMLLVAFPAFTCLFLIASYFGGLYDNGFKQSRLNKSTVISIGLLLSVYALLPESLRFSRGILFFGSVLAFLLITLVRRILISLNIIESAEESETGQTVIAGSQAEYNEISHYIEKTNKKEQILGRIAPDKIDEPNTVGSFGNLQEILNLYPIKELIFCEGTLSFRQIIEKLPSLPRKIRVRFFAKGSHMIIGSDDKNSAGDFVLETAGFNLSKTVYRRAKNLFDVTACFCFLIFFPFVFLAKKRPLNFFKNVFDVLLRKKTWIGYSLGEPELPNLRKGIITTTGLPSALNNLPAESLLATDKLYAKHYSTMLDIKLVSKNYRLLS
jgi:O-antigen biosynthesis protein